MPPSANRPPDELALLVLRPPKALRLPDLREFWRYRDLLVFLALRDIQVRYRQTLLGAAWAILQPVLTMAVFSMIFGRLARIPSDGLPYPVFALTALLPWQLFSFTLSTAANSLVNNERILTKVYFPRLIIPLGSVGAGLLDFAIAFVVLVAMMAWYGLVPTAAIFVLPLVVLLALLAAVAVGLWLAALNVQYRDVRFAIPFLLQFWLFATPVAYPSSLIPERWRLLYGLNPMAGVVESFRWALLPGAPPPGPMLFVSCSAVVVLLFGGLVYFRSMERVFADVV